MEASAELDAGPDRDDASELDQAVAARESHAAIGRDGVADERGDRAAPEAARPVSPEVDEAEVAAEVEAAAKRGKTVELGGGTHVVTPQDSLWSLAAATYGHGKYWKKLRAANPGRVRARQDGTRDLIRDGETLVLPLLEIPTLEAMQAFADNDTSLRDLAVGMSDADYEAFLATMPTGTRIDKAALLQQVEIARSTGMTYAEMVAEQRRFWEEQAAVEGVSVGEYVAETVARGPAQDDSTADWDLEVTRGREQEWIARFDAAVAKVRSEAKPEVKAAIEEAERNGGGTFHWAPAKVLKKNAFALGWAWNINVGMDWVSAVEQDVDRVSASIFHEMVGHGAQESFYAMNIAYDASRSLDPAEQAKLPSDTAMNRTFGYWEAEIFAELYEFTFDSKVNLTDHAFEVDRAGGDMTKADYPEVNDVRDLLAEAKQVISPALLPGLVRGLWRRLETDPHVIDRARELFRRDVEEVVGDIL